ncbi:alpha/beta fold hydrolase [Myxococcota bacterium]|nr:alpha/beta fold hydrolase [Myxococcota bacterium]MBU1432930.1 alpha/beta fold hydrolase [Myxococcota bacterium]
MEYYYLYHVTCHPRASLRGAFGAVESPDFRGLRLEARLVVAEASTRGCERLVIVGLSFGGLVAARLTHRHPERVGGLVLCAPALHREEAEVIDAAPHNTHLIHGLHDDGVPIESSRAFSARHGLPLLEEDDHRLTERLKEIIEATREILKPLSARRRLKPCGRARR